MTEVNYTAPLSSITRTIILTTAMVAALLSWLVWGFHTAPTRTFFFIFYTLQITWFVIDPGLCYIWFSRTQPDGTKVKVKRPVIGFKRCETVRGLVDDDDGYRHERALVRI
ncbi:hypothetical protein P170DRAFT_440179 [Aspergillus steynii IBT 23096]|uniref:Uncharacterized protein n=1 Tax=Aspergillus steynii IBT 23096 TaxID=1392250 RepID=A0A2I2FWN0_9EURO|nr:uncharacterized protein P170DRAFT_440179 [Aspergillus steynii IBT 23096]PLB45017.1 hypothetical protein P170DRAFT_440179 [Aspergillus steynii IBT 23096]